MSNKRTPALGGTETEPPACWIESTRGPDDEPVCLFTFGPHQSYPTVEDVRATARDLFTVAADADTCGQLARLGFDPETISGFMSDLLAHRGRGFYGRASTLSARPAGSSKEQRGYVLLLKGTTNGMIFPDEAREMAMCWFAVAAGTEQDQMLGEALRTCTQTTDAEVANIYAYMKALREKNAA